MIRISLFGKIAATLRVADLKERDLPELLRSKDKFFKFFTDQFLPSFENRMTNVFMTEMPRGLLFTLPETRLLALDQPSRQHTTEQDRIQHLAQLAKKHATYLNVKLPQVIFNILWKKEMDPQQKGGISAQFESKRAEQNEKALNVAMEELNRILSGNVSYKRVLEFAHREHLDFFTETPLKAQGKPAKGIAESDAGLTEEQKDIAERVRKYAKKIVNIFVEERPDTLWEKLDETSGLTKEDMADLTEGLVYERMLPLKEKAAERAEQMRNTFIRALNKVPKDFLEHYDVPSENFSGYLNELFHSALAAVIEECPRRAINVKKDDRGKFQNSRLPNYEKPAFELWNDVTTLIPARVRDDMRLYTGAKIRNPNAYATEDTEAGLVKGEEAEGTLAKLHDVKSELDTVMVNLLEAEDEAHDFILLVHHLQNFHDVIPGVGHNKGVKVDSIGSRHEGPAINRAQKAAAALMSMVAVERKKMRHYHWFHDELTKLDQDLDELTEGRGVSEAGWNWTKAVELINKARNLIDPQSQITSDKTLTNQFLIGAIQKAFASAYGSSVSELTAGPEPSEGESESNKEKILTIKGPLLNEFKSDLFRKEIPRMLEEWALKPEIKQKQIMQKTFTHPGSLEEQALDYLSRQRGGKIKINRMSPENRSKYADVIRKIENMYKRQNRSLPKEQQRVLEYLNEDDIRAVRSLHQGGDAAQEAREQQKLKLNASKRVRTGSTFLRRLFRMTLLGETSNV